MFDHYPNGRWPNMAKPTHHQNCPRNRVEDDFFAVLDESKSSDAEGTAGPEAENKNHKSYHGLPQKIEKPITTYHNQRCRKELLHTCLFYLIVGSYNCKLRFVNFLFHEFHFHCFCFLPHHFLGRASSQHLSRLGGWNSLKKHIWTCSFFVLKSTTLKMCVSEWLLGYLAKL